MYEELREFYILLLALHIVKSIIIYFWKKKLEVKAFIVRSRINTDLDLNNLEILFCN